jgi:hypothetical protein
LHLDTTSCTWILEIYCVGNTIPIWVGTMLNTNNTPSGTYIGYGTYCASGYIISVIITLQGN